MGNGKEPSVSVSMSLRITTERVLELAAQIKMTTKSAYVEQALWEKFARDFLPDPKFRKALVDHVVSLSPEE